MCVVHGVVRGERRKWGGGGRMEWVRGNLPSQEFFVSEQIVERKSIRV